MALNLYWNVGSQPARAVKCLLNLGKIQHKAITMDISNNQTRTNEYLQMNPLGQIPFITDGSFKLAQSNAILVYLCEKYPKQLGIYYGKDLQQRGLVNQHLSWYQNQFRPALFKTIFLKIYEGIKKQKPVYQRDLQVAEKDMYNAMAQLQKQLKLSKFDFVAGSELTIADLQYFFEITNFIIYGKQFSKFELITSWFNRMLQNEQVKNIHTQWQKIAPIIATNLSNVKVIQKSKL